MRSALSSAIHSALSPGTYPMPSTSLAFALLPAHGWESIVWSSVSPGAGGSESASALLPPNTMTTTPSIAAHNPAEIRSFPCPTAATSLGRNAPSTPRSEFQPSTSGNCPRRPRRRTRAPCGPSEWEALDDLQEPELGGRLVVRLAVAAERRPVLEEPLVRLDHRRRVGVRRVPVELPLGLRDVEPQRLAVEQPVVRRERHQRRLPEAPHRDLGGLGRQRHDVRPGAGVVDQRLQRLAHRAEVATPDVVRGRAGPARRAQ